MELVHCAASSPDEGSGTATWAVGRERRRSRARRSGDRDQRLLAELCQALLDANARPSLVINESFGIIAINRAARSFLGNSAYARIVGDRLKLASRRAERLLQKLFDPDCTTNGRIRYDDQHCHLTGSQLLLKSAGVRLAVVRIEDHQGAHIELIQRELGLTRAESEIAWSISRGLSLVEVAKQRSASINTVKTQVRYIFQKSGLRSKVALATHLARMEHG